MPQIKATQLVKEILTYIYKNSRSIITNLLILDGILILAGLMIAHFSSYITIAERQEEVVSTAFFLLSLWIEAPFSVSLYNSIINDEPLSLSA